MFTKLLKGDWESPTSDFLGTVRVYIYIGGNKQTKILPWEFDEQMRVIC